MITILHKTSHKIHNCIYNFQSRKNYLKKRVGSSLHNKTGFNWDHKNVANIREYDKGFIYLEYTCIYQNSYIYKPWNPAQTPLVHSLIFNYQNNMNFNIYQFGLAFKICVK